MHYYYYYDTNNNICFIETSVDLKENGEAEYLIEITHEAFEELSAEMDKKAEEEARIAEEEILAEQKRIENLERENASLLFQLLTGEEYTDV